MHHKKVLLVYGGRSVEHEISIRSAKNVDSYIDREKFDVTLIGIDKSGKWFLQSEVSEKFDISRPVAFKLDASQPVLVDTNHTLEIKPDIIFPVLHGTDGEDGSIQGLFTTLNLPVVGSGVLGSSISMDKLVTKQLFLQAGIPTSDHLHFNYSSKEKINYEEVSKTLGVPVIVKPVSLGSSVGVSKASNKNEFNNAIEECFKYDNHLLIERFIEGREFECAILGNNPPLATIPGEIIVGDDYEFYDYDAKYVDAMGAKTIIPANMEESMIPEIKKIAIAAYETLRCEDYARVDFFMDKKNRIYINEINTIPGFTNISMFPKLWEYEGINNRELISRMIENCLTRFEEKKRILTDFESALK